MSYAPGVPSDRLCFVFAVGLYGLATGFAVLMWQRGFRRDNRALYALIFAGLMFHTWAMFQRGFRLDACPINNLYEATVFLLWTAGSAYLGLGLFSRLRFVGALVAPLLFGVGVFALMPALDPPRGPRPDFNTNHAWQSAHAAFILLAYGAFGLGALAGVMYLAQARDLKQNKARAALSLLPPISRLEGATETLLIAGLLLLSGGLIAGTRYLKLATGSYLSADPFVLYSAATWLVYAGLLLGRWRYDQRGRRFAWVAVASFGVLLLTFWGVYQLSGLHSPGLRPKSRARITRPSEPRMSGSGWSGALGRSF